MPRRNSWGQLFYSASFNRLLLENRGFGRRSELADIAPDGADVTSSGWKPNGTYLTNSPSPWEGRAKRGEGYPPGFRFTLPGPERADPP
ncbi:MAG: hypothetical protein Rhob2KO_51450 [Rhodopirellula baltica]